MAPPPMPPPPPKQQMPPIPQNQQMQPQKQPLGAFQATLGQPRPMLQPTQQQQVQIAQTFQTQLQSIMKSKQYHDASVGQQANPR